ncbi:methionyl-tRNA formyltransferase [Thermosipho sp. 1063]|uniref:methionyl-tRNA formyltransferase n=1 Tax=unclassified Thermosipho (in: thermotogales) TaxID=2676525 RepID=UPI0009493658|nr:MULTISPECIES: methionyl-tRNA formyltransferase [unclassified Thermosipho (in: thermotogales)]ANQ53349.1 methionyl-tRNA formyltransferase [Thermosipho sp. 1070]APT71799.1 methionyl-tRNA formyltransferase [Thermosipho sp. 1063]OOC45304.1 methionyl-tRNA formyltransferase [Thermosipho sp. 1074]
MKILFLGTPDFARTHLEYLIENGFNIVAVISQPDKPKGRGKKISFTPVKEIALKYNIPVFQPKSLNKEGLKIIEEFKPDVGVVVAYGKLLKPPFLDALEFFNVHASLLPKYRGAAPIQRALENGEKVTGITIFKIGEGMDDGPIALKGKVNIGNFETFGELYLKLLNVGKKLLVEFLKNYPLNLTPQEGEVSFAPKISKEDLVLDFSRHFCKVKDKIRAYDPLPGVKVDFNGNFVKLFGVVDCIKENTKEYGKVVAIDKEGALISCEGGYVKIKYIQFPGKKKMTFYDAKNGGLIKEGEYFGG